MAGIYIHIPWCRKVCIYCDFHFSVSMRNKDELLDCMINEIKLQHGYLGTESIRSIYFGGGTPSVLTSLELSNIIFHIKSNYRVADNVEITIEANPDDMSLPYLVELKKLGINRLSIGIQSFFDDDLTWMNRRHNRNQAVDSINNSHIAGFDNISIDLIYGLPGMHVQKWIKNLAIAFKSNIQHISAYHLTLESKTVYAHQVKKCLMKEPDEGEGLKHFETLIDLAEKEGFIHYEISNFCRPGFISLHNSSYWLQQPYLGIGPSANSYNGNSRQWNIRNNSEYIKMIREGIIPCDHEKLDLKDKYNEYILTSLRTYWGIDMQQLKKEFGTGYLSHFINESRDHMDNGKLIRNGNQIFISRSGKFFADGIISDLFISD